MRTEEINSTYRSGASKSSGVTTEQLSITLMQQRQSICHEIDQKIRNNNHTWDRGNSQLFKELQGSVARLRGRTDALVNNVRWFFLAIAAWATFISAWLATH